MAHYSVKLADGRTAQFDHPNAGLSKDEVQGIVSEKMGGQKQDAFQKFGKYLPTAGAVAGGILGGAGGTIGGLGVGGVPGAVGGAALGAGAGEAGRQLLGRALGEPSPQTSMQAAKQIGTQGAIGAGGELLGQGVGALAGTAFKGLPKFGQAISGTPSRNIAKAQLRGFKDTYFPSVAKGLSRESAGSAKGAAEEVLMKKYLQPSEVADLALRDSGYAKGIVKDSLTKFKMGIPLTPDEAFKTVKSIDVIYRDTPQGMKVAPELAKLRKSADGIVSSIHPEYKAAKRASEATILRSQLLKPFRVNKTNPDELSGFSGALGAFKPAAYLATAPFSPLSFGVVGSLLGSAKRAIPPMARKAIQRALIQSGIRSDAIEGTMQQLEQSK